MSYTLIERKELTEAASSISFDNIPQFYSDLVAMVSGRTAIGGEGDGMTVRFNNNTLNYSARRLYAYNTSVATDTNVGQFIFNGDTSTTNTFSNVSVYIPNYSGSTDKSFSVDGIAETNGTNRFIGIGSVLWSNTAPITSVTFLSENGVNLLAGSSISLYGINRQQAIGLPKAIGGQISFANGYWYHSFTGSGTFLTQQRLDADYIVVAGGGGGGSTEGGGGGAGGVITATETIPVGSYAITVGAGGSGAANGVNSTFFNRTAIGGGRGGSSSTAGSVGGSGGGGGADWNTATSGGAGTSGQGNAGGSSTRRLVGGNGGGYGGGGGGAGASGSNASSWVGGPGGAGIPWNNGQFYGGGGGGGVSQSATYGTVPSTPGGIGGGGKGSGSTSAPGPSFTGSVGTANTGGGGGGGGGDQLNNGQGYAGGSGVVIIRYKA